MRMTLLALLLTFLGTGCVLRATTTTGRSSAPAARGGRCPPGHVWSDGRCHDRGHGHDKRHR